jgi:hypothetical protein
MMALTVWDDRELPVGIVMVSLDPIGVPDMPEPIGTMSGAYAENCMSVCEFV